MSTEQIPPQAEADVNDQNTTPTSQGEDSTTPGTGTVATDTADTSREDLIQSLVQKPVEEKAEAEPESTEETPDDEDDEVESSTESAKPSEAETSQKSRTGADLENDKRFKEHTRKTISELRKQAAFGDVITQTLQNAKMTPEEFANWTALAARVKRGDPEAVGVLIATAKEFGWKESTAPEKPKVKTVDDLAAEIYSTDFKAEVDDLQIGEQVARKTARRLAEAQFKAEKPEPEPQRQPVPQQQQRQPADPIREAALDRVTRMEAEYVRSNPNYVKVAPAVTERLRTLANGDPLMWPAQYQDIVREELRKLSPPVSKPAIKPVAGTQVRSSTAPAPKAQPVDPKRQLAIDIAAGKFAQQ